MFAHPGAELFDLRSGGVGLEQRVVNERSELGGGKLSGVHGLILATDETRMKHRFFATRRRCGVNALCYAARLGFRR